MLDIRRHGVVVLAAAVALVLAGCGLADPYQHPTSTPTASTTPAIVDNEVQPTHPYRDSRRPAAPAVTPALAIERFAGLYINWTYRTLAAHRRQLADMAIGTAAAAQRRGAVESSHDYELAQGKVVNRGQLVAVAPRRPGRVGDYVVVTRETTSGTDTYDGLPPAYHVTLASVQAVPGGYAISAWDPQN